MNTLLLSALILGGPTSPDVKFHDTVWYGNLDKAAREAAARRKPLLVLDMVGKLSDEFC